MRKLQRYMVSLPECQFRKLLSNGDVCEISPGIFVQTADGLYHPDLGVLVDKMIPEPGTLCA